MRTLFVRASALGNQDRHADQQADAVVTGAAVPASSTAVLKRWGRRLKRST